MWRWRAFFAGCLTSLALFIQVVIFLPDKLYTNALSISLVVLALVCFVLALIGACFDCQYFRQKNKEGKKVEIRKALREAVKRLNPEYTEEQIDWWLNDK